MFCEIASKPPIIAKTYHKHTMSILLQIDIYSSILKKLPLNDLIVLRRVCHEWKQWIDDYLKRQKVLLLALDNEKNYKCLTRVTQTMGINYSKFLLNKLHITRIEGRKKCIAKALLRTFPNVDELYISKEDEGVDYITPYEYTIIYEYLEKNESIDYSILITGWKSTLKRVIFTDWSAHQISSATFECLNKCDKLESFGAWDTCCSPSLNPTFLKERFFTRLSSLWLGSHETTICHPKITGIALPGSFSDSVDRFPNCQRGFSTGYFFDKRRYQHCNISEELNHLAELKHENLSCLEIQILVNHNGSFDQDWSQTTFQLDEYPPFSAELNRLSGVRTLKFEFGHPGCLEYILHNSADFDHVETLIINYKCKFYSIFYRTALQLPTYFVELLPKTVNRIQNMEFHLEPQNFDESLRKNHFSEFPYKVKIFRDL